MVDLAADKKFERQVERIHQLIEVEGSTVTWNDHIPDPDNPSQPRQIDITIRRDGALTIVECRIHKDPQDVTWIEALIGRRMSLKADAAIAVSASGFTEGARKKANVYGIHLRDFASLSEEEIENWGKTRTFTLNFCEFTDVILTIRASGQPGAGPPTLTDFEGKSPSQLVWRMLYQSIMRKLAEDKWDGHAITLDSQIGANLLVNSKPPDSMSIRANVRRLTQSVQLTSVVLYADPITDTGHAEIAHYSLGESEIVENCGDEQAMTIDLSTVVVPDNCCLDTVFFDAGRTVDSRLRFIGSEQSMNFQIPMKICYTFSNRPECS